MKRLARFEQVSADKSELREIWLQEWSLDELNAIVRWLVRQR